MTETTDAPLSLSYVLPPTWRRRRGSDPARGVVVAARAPALPPSGVRPEVVLHRAAVPDADLGTWREAATAELADLLDDAHLDDHDRFDLMGHEVDYRRLTHRLGTADVVCEQWAWLAGGTGVVLTCSAALEDYPDYCDLFELVAESVELAEPTPPVEVA
ncbi:hypothetical protein [Nocardioides marinquilinus]